MPIDRRNLLGAGATLAAAAGAFAASGPRASAATPAKLRFGLRAELDPSPDKDQSATLQKLIDQAAINEVPLLLPAGRYRASSLSLRTGTRLIGTAGQTTLVFAGGRTFLTALEASDIRVENLTLDGDGQPLDAALADALLATIGTTRLVISELTVTRSQANGISLRTSSGRIIDCLVNECANTGIFSLDARGLEISHNEVKAIGNNGIQVWRTDQGEDGTIVSANRISGIKSSAGGTGENGNGVNIFRAGSVEVIGNRVTDCAFSAVRSNAGSNCQIIANSCSRIGEVALYAEFGFEGAIISGNLVEQAAQGISVTNFNNGGRLAIVSGNLIRNLSTRESSEDRRGIGISVEADAVVSGNVVESAPIAGIVAGFDQYMRDIAITGNVVRKTGIGIGISGSAAGGTVLVANNLISGAAGGAIRAMERETPTGPDLVRGDVNAYPHIRLSGNVSG